MILAYFGAVVGVLMIAGSFGFLMQTDGEKALVATTFLTVVGFALLLAAGAYLGSHGVAA